MDKIKFDALNLSVNTETNTFTYADQTIEVLKYLPSAQKYNLLVSTLDASFEDGVYNEFLIDTFFHLFLVFAYTNIEFSDADHEDNVGLYDKLKSNGLINAIINAMDPDEYTDLVDTLNEMCANRMDYNISAAAMVKTFINDLPKNVEAAAEMIKNFDPKQYQAVIDFANAANGKRDIKTNAPVIVATANG